MVVGRVRASAYFRGGGHWPTLHYGKCRVVSCACREVRVLTSSSRYACHTRQLSIPRVPHNEAD